MVAFKQSVISLVPALTSFLYQVAPESYDSPAGSYAIAEFNDEIKGYVEFTPASSGSLDVKVDLSGLPDEGGPFMYHIHEFAVPTDEDCYKTGLHLNPYHGVSPCSLAVDNSFCESGDLSGKHGFIYGKELTASYNDPYISLNSENPAFIGGLSVTIHLADNTRIACSNITIGTQSELKDVVLDSDNSTSTTIYEGASPANGVTSGAFVVGFAGLAAMLL